MIWEAFSDSVVEETPVVDMELVTRSIHRAIQQPAPVTMVTTLSELQWPAVRVRSPTSEEIRPEFATSRVGTVPEVVDGHTWYAGPTLGAGGLPASLRAVNEHFSTKIQLDLFWDLWIGHPDGRALLEAGVRRVLARPGWQRLGEAPVT